MTKSSRDVQYVASALVNRWFGSKLPQHEQVPLLRSEIPSGICAKLRTVAASNNRVHPTRSLYYCLFAPHIHSVFLHAHPVRGESHIQRNATGEVATPSRKKVFYFKL